MKTKTLEVWCCGIAADYELGHTKVYVYHTKEACEKDNPCTTVEPEWCAVRKLTITFETGLGENVLEGKQ